MSRARDVVDVVARALAARPNGVQATECPDEGLLHQGLGQVPVTDKPEDMSLQGRLDIGTEGAKRFTVPVTYTL